MALSMDDRDGKIWFNGELVEWRSATTHVLTHTLHYGMGVFEGVRAYETPDGPAIFRLQDHTKRLFNSAKIVGMQLPFTEEQINRAHIDVVKANNLASCYFRPMAYYGSGKLGVAPKQDDVQVILAAWAWGAYLGEEGMRKGIRVRVSSFTRHHPNVTMIKAKANGNYMNSIMANTEATRDGYDEAILLDAQGYVAEGSGENIFTVRDGVLYTPALDVALDGITRRSVIAIASEMGLKVVEKRLTRDELYVADEVFFTGTAAEVTPIREIDGRQIGIGERGPITAEIQQRYFDIVQGKNPKYRDWLTYVKQLIRCKGTCHEQPKQSRHHYPARPAAALFRPRTRRFVERASACFPADSVGWRHRVSVLRYLLSLGRQNSSAPLLIPRSHHEQTRRRPAAAFISCRLRFIQSRAPVRTDSGRGGITNLLGQLQSDQGPAHHGRLHQWQQPDDG